MTIQMTAKKACRYGTRSLQPGDDFEVVGQSEARLYSALKWADPKVAEPEPAKSEYTPPATDAYVAVGSTRFSDGEPQTDESLAAAGNDPGLVGSLDEPRQKRKYTRRDLTAE